MPNHFSSTLHFFLCRSWSFGVLLWEIFTLGGSPLQGIDPVTVASLVCSGRQNPKPELASREVYALMQACWSIRAAERPSFDELFNHLYQLECTHPQSPLVTGDGGRHQQQQLAPSTVGSGANLTDLNSFGSYLLPSSHEPYSNTRSSHPSISVATTKYMDVLTLPGVEHYIDEPIV